MKYIRYIWLCLFALWMASPLPLTAEEKEQYVDPVFGDTINREADDFVTVSLVVADPGKVFYSVLGHACLRMQCPTFGLDYCYTYESEDLTNRVGDFLMGKLRMGLFNIPFDEYCSYYEANGRGVREYVLNLPPKAEQELWKILDQHVAQGTNLDFDYYNRGCAITCVQFVKQALGNRMIQYDSSLREYAPTARELGKKYTKNARWVLFYWGFIAGEDVSQPLHGDNQLLIPEDLVNAWQKATLNGKPLLVSEPNILVAGHPQRADGWLTPWMATLLMLLLAIANLFWSKPYGDWVMLAIQTVLGVILVYLMYFSNLCCASWNWLLIPFNPLPAILWYWRKWWALPYAIALFLWCVAMTAIAFWGHVLVDWPHILLVLTWMVVLLKQTALWKRIKC